MAKETKKQIKAQLINEVQRSYQQKMDNYENHISYLSGLFQREQAHVNELREKNKALTDENLKLKNQVEQYQEWVERMQDFCNLPENERQTAFKTYLNEIESKTEANETLNSLGHMFSNYFKILF